MANKLVGVVPLEGQRLMYCFEDETIWLWELNDEELASDRFAPLSETETFDTVQVRDNGGSVAWDGVCRCECRELRRRGNQLPLTREDFLYFCQRAIVSTAEAAEMLGCTRQNIDSLTRRGKLTPVKVYAKNKLFFRSDIARRNRACRD